MSRAGDSLSTDRKARIVAFVIKGSLSKSHDLFSLDTGGAEAELEAKDDEKCSDCS